MATLQERHPDLFGPVNREPCRGKKRTVPMECLCLGMPRTGTATMAMALETLGLHAWHSLLFFSTNFGDIEMWAEAVENKYYGKGPDFKRPEFDQLLHNFGGVAADSPAIAFAQDLIEAYPEAKVVLVHRDIDSWYRSFSKSVVAELSSHRFSWWNRFTMRIDPWFTGPLGGLHVQTITAWLDSYSADEMRAKAKDKFRAHYKHIREVTPPERLLEYKLTDGWEPLCKFLDKPIPDKPFPHTNEAAHLREKIAIQTSQSFWKFCGLATKFVVPLGVAAAAAYFGWKRYNATLA